jgi:hypothetical protein
MAFEKERREPVRQEILPGPSEDVERSPSGRCIPESHLRQHSFPDERILVFFPFNRRSDRILDSNPVEEIASSKSQTMS